MNIKRGFQRIFIVLAILWLIPVAIFTIDLMPKAPIINEWELDSFIPDEAMQRYTEDLSLFSNEELLLMREATQKGERYPTDEPSGKTLRKRAAIRELQRCGKLPEDPNLIYKPSSFWKSEEGKKIIQKANIKISRDWRKENFGQQVTFILKAVLFWVIPLVCIYIMGILIWWITTGFSGKV